MSPTWQRATGNVVRGGMIDAVEAVPGVSGGTVALIVGVPERRGRCGRGRTPTATCSPRATT